MATEQGYKYYSKEELDEKLLDDFIYSTTEKACGKWINGETVYKKTIEFGNLPNATSKSVVHGISNVGQFVKIEALAFFPTSKRTLPLPYASSAGADYHISLTVDATEVNINTINTNRSDYLGYITLFYTKDVTS